MEEEVTGSVSGNESVLRHSAPKYHYWLNIKVTPKGRQRQRDGPRPAEEGDNSRESLTF